MSGIGSDVATTKSHEGEIYLFRARVEFIPAYTYASIDTRLHAALLMFLFAEDAMAGWIWTVGMRGRGIDGTSWALPTREGVDDGTGG